MRDNNVIIDQNGDRYFPLLERNEEIKGKLQEAYDILKKEKETCRALKSKEKMGGRFAIQLESVLRSYGLMTATEFTSISYQELEDTYNAFMDLIAHYNLTFEIVPNKQLFCAFMRINSRQFGELELGGVTEDKDIKEKMLHINDSLLSISFMSTEFGNAEGKSTYNRLTAHGNAGHGLIKENEKQAIDNGMALPSFAEIESAFASKFGTPKKLPKK